MPRRCSLWTYMLTVVASSAKVSPWMDEGEMMLGASCRMTPMMPMRTPSTFSIT